MFAFNFYIYIIINLTMTNEYLNNNSIISLFHDTTKIKNHLQRNEAIPIANNLKSSISSIPSISSTSSFTFLIYTIGSLWLFARTQFLMLLITGSSPKFIWYSPFSKFGFRFISLFGKSGCCSLWKKWT